MHSSGFAFLAWPSLSPLMILPCSSSIIRRKIIISNAGRGWRLEKSLSKCYMRIPALCCSTLHEFLRLFHYYSWAPILWRSELLCKTFTNQMGRFTHSKKRWGVLLHRQYLFYFGYSLLLQGRNDISKEFRQSREKEPSVFIKLVPSNDLAQLLRLLLPQRPCTL